MPRRRNQRPIRQSTLRHAQMLKHKTFEATHYQYPVPVRETVDTWTPKLAGCWYRYAQTSMYNIRKMFILSLQLLPQCIDSAF